MNGPALLLLLLTACVVRGGVFQLWNMIVCVQPTASPLAYSDYGCYCGHEGTVTPVDEVDKCCQTHTSCYDRSKTTKCTVFDVPSLLLYKYNCADQQVTCSESNGVCKAAVCECDRAMVQCFANNTYNPQNQFIGFTVRCKD